MIFKLLIVIFKSLLMLFKSLSLFFTAVLSMSALVVREMEKVQNLRLKVVALPSRTILWRWRMDSNWWKCRVFYLFLLSSFPSYFLPSLVASSIYSTMFHCLPFSLRFPLHKSCLGFLFKISFPFALDGWEIFNFIVFKIK